VAGLVIAIVVGVTHVTVTVKEFVSAVAAVLSVIRINTVAVPKTSLLTVTVPAVKVSHVNGAYVALKPPDPVLS